MKKIKQLAILGMFSMFAISCETSEKDKLQNEKEIVGFQTELLNKNQIEANSSLVYRSLLDSVVTSLDCVAVSGVAARKVVVLVDSVVVPAVETEFDPKKMLFNKESSKAKFSISYHFWELLSAKPVKNCRGGKFYIFQTITRAEDFEMLAQTRVKPLSEDEFFTLLAHLVSKQPNGEKGKLKTDGSSNLFHIETSQIGTITVSVNWLGRNDGWDLSACGSGSWTAGDLVF